MAALVEAPALFWVSLVSVPFWVSFPFLVSSFSFFSFPLPARLLRSVLLKPENFLLSKKQAVLPLWRDSFLLVPHDRWRDLSPPYSPLFRSPLVSGDPQSPLLLHPQTKRQKRLLFWQIVPVFDRIFFSLSSFFQGDAHYLPPLVPGHRAHPSSPPARPLCLLWMLAPFHSRYHQYDPLPESP